MSTLLHRSLVWWTTHIQPAQMMCQNTLFGPCMFWDSILMTYKLFFCLFFAYSHRIQWSKHLTIYLLYPISTNNLWCPSWVIEVPELKYICSTVYPGLFLSSIIESRHLGLFLFSILRQFLIHVHIVVEFLIRQLRMRCRFGLVSNLNLPLGFGAGLVWVWEVHALNRGQSILYILQCLQQSHICPIKSVPMIPQRVSL